MKDKGLQDHIKGWLLLGRCINLAGLRRIPEAIDSAKQAREFFRDQGSLWGEAWVCTFLQSFYLTTGDLASCEETALYGLELAKTLDSSQCRVSLNVGLSFLRSLQGRADEADAHIREAARECSASSMYQAWVAAARVVAANARGDGDQAVEHMRACLSLCRANGLDTLLMTIFPMILVPLADLYASGDMGDYLEALFTGMDPGLKAIVEWLAANGDENVARACTVILGVLPRPAPPGLRVCCLGRFRLFQGEREILSKSWPSRKARMLFKLLVHYRSRGYVSKEVFMEHLWPEDDPQKTAKRFHVALATVRKVVAGGNGRETASYVKSDGDTYLLDLGDGGSVDVDEFEAACDAAREARDAALAAGHLLRALSLFQGDFLEEDLYEPWCGAERDRLKDKHLSVLASIADYYRAEKDFPKAVEFCGRYLDKDPYAEDVYQQLMLIHGVTGNRAMVKKIYDRCRRNIVEGLGCALSPETEEIADELLS
jgi:DNA-binding SARP family transcriptional activator